MHTNRFNGEAKTPIRISLRKLTEEQAKQALKHWTGTPAFRKSEQKLFGTGAAKSWTFAILSDLKDKVHEIQRGRLPNLTVVDVANTDRRPCVERLVIT